MKANNFLTPEWNVPSHIHAAMSLRSGGVSEHVYSSLNPASHVGDDDTKVLENRQFLRESLQLPSEPVWLEQTHSATVIQAEKLKSEMNADASFTAESGVVCAVLTADCLPILLCSKKGEKIASIHVGWRGLLAGIISHTITAMQTTDLSVWLGVAIGRCCFEVGSEVRALFVAKNPHNAQAFIATDAPEKYLADIYQLARIELAFHKVTDIYGGQYCSMCDAQQFYSYRRDQQTGRMATLIWKD